MKVSNANNKWLNIKKTMLLINFIDQSIFEISGTQ